MRRPYGPLLLAMALGMLLLPMQGWAAGDGPESSKQESAAAPARLFGSGKQEIAIAVGYAIPLPVGNTTPEIDDLQYVFLAPRWGIGITNPLGGDAFYRGNFELLVEGQFFFETEPTSGWGGDSRCCSGTISFPKANSFPLWRPGQAFSVWTLMWLVKMTASIFHPKPGWAFITSSLRIRH